MKNKIMMIIAMIAILCVSFVSCTKDNGSGGNDNTGIEFRMKSTGNGEDHLWFFEYGHGYVNLYITSSINFSFGPSHGYNDIGISSVGLVNKLSKIEKIPNSGWTDDEIAVHPGKGYVIRAKESESEVYHYARIYVEDWIESTSGGIIGAVIWYDDNWK